MFKDMYIDKYEKSPRTPYRMPYIDMTATGRNIARLRQEAGLSVSDVQRIFGFTTPQAIYKWQKGLSLPTIDNLIVLADVFNVRMDDIIVKASA